MDEQLNHLGAAIFWLYILAALFFTAIILKTLHNMEPAKETRKHVWTFSLMALISFATLSYNMLNVLVQSYTAWMRQRNMRIADTSLSTIWHWSITSTLFQDFGNAILQDSQRYLWVEASLLATMCVCLFMGIEGRYRQVPRLWAFIALSQILPISFTQNLFYIALLRRGGPPTQWAVSRTAIVLLSGAYCACLIGAPVTAGSLAVIPVIGIGRMLLLCMEASSWASGQSGNTIPEADAYDRDGLSAYLVMVSTCCVFGQACLAFSEAGPGEIARAVFSHPAVSSLGCDVILSLASYLLWRAVNDATKEGLGEKAE